MLPADIDVHTVIAVAVGRRQMQVQFSAKPGAADEEERVTTETSKPVDEEPPEASTSVTETEDEEK